MPKIGIGIVTYNRVVCLKNVVEKVRELTSGRYALVVADDGSEDGTLKYLKSEKIKVITGRNKGVCWNKNRALLALETLNCDPILLLEDDCYPVEKGWDIYWRAASALWHHVNFAHPKLQQFLISGAGTPQDPYVNQKSTAQCAAASATLLRKIGYYDTRFKGYGVGHAEWTTRAKRAGHGFKSVKLEDGRTARANLYITGGLEADDAPTFKDRANVAKNEKLFESIKDEPIYRFPWSTPEEREELRQEFARAKLVNHWYFDGDQKQVPVTDEANPLGEFNADLERSALVRKAVSRVFDDPRSIINKASWVESLMTDVPTFNRELVPWFNYACIHFLRSKRSPAWKDWRVLEFGSGYSTAWWSRHVREVVAIEHNQEWVELVTKLLGRNAKVVSKSDANVADYIKTGFDQPGEFQVIVVDGVHREHFRANIAKKLSPDGIIILDNSERAPYDALKADLSTSGFKELQFFGLGPMTPRSTVTSIFYRTENVLGI